MPDSGLRRRLSSTQLRGHIVHQPISRLVKPRSLAQWPRNLSQGAVPSLLEAGQFLSPKPPTQVTRNQANPSTQEAGPRRDRPP